MEVEHLDELPPPELRRRLAAITAAVAHEGYELAESDTYVNIVNGNYGAVIDVHAHGADVNVAYWHSGPQADAVMRSVIGLVGEIRAETGWTVFDPQRGEIVTDLDELAAGGAGEMDRITRWADRNIRRRPWWKFWG
jgi:hypothetical protein